VDEKCANHGCKERTWKGKWRKEKFREKYGKRNQE
jgi:hypothetical protein